MTVMNRLVWFILGLSQSLFDLTPFRSKWKARVAVWDAA